VPLEGHWERQQRSPLGRRERRTLAILAAALVAGTIALVLVLALRGASSTTAAGCVDVTIASTTGGARIHACGARARRLCSDPAAPAVVRERCRRAGL
jgi:hypothetical protein